MVEDLNLLHTSLHLENISFKTFFCQDIPKILKLFLFISGAGTSSVNRRLFHHLTCINLCLSGSSVLSSIYGRVLLAWLEEFPSCSIEHHYELSKVRNIKQNQVLVQVSWLKSLNNASCLNYTSSL